MSSRRTLASSLVACLSLSASLYAGAAGLQLEELTSPELRERIAAGTTTVLVPIGGTEQNGAHLVLGKHNVRVRVLAERIAVLDNDARADDLRHPPCRAAG